MKLHLEQKDFNQKENKFLEEFLDLKALKDKVEDKLFKQGQSIQTVHMMCKPRSFYDEVNKVAIGYKNPLCLHRARQVQPALYSGHVIVTPNHAPAVVRDCEETLELSEISRKKMHDKMRAKACVDNKVNFTPPNYSKENFLATFSPQKQLTPEQLFWSQDIVKMKAEALKEQNTRPIKALTVYPPNTPATLVPRRIHTTGIPEGERGFEQTKTCYLTEVIPCFKTLQEHFEGIQKALTKEVKEMSDAFDELEAELEQSAVDRKHDAIERKNLLLEHDNIIADCLLKEVFYVASNSELNVVRFTEMQKAHHIVKTRCLELEVELSNLRIDIRKDNYNDLLNRFSNLEVNHLNLQLKYQNLKDSFQNKPSSSVNDTPDFNSIFVIGQNVKLPSRKDKNRSNALQKGNERLKVPNTEYGLMCHYNSVKSKATAQESYALDVGPFPLAIGNTREVFNQLDKKHANTPRKKQVTFADQCATSSGTTNNHVEPMHTRKSNVPVPPSTGVNSCSIASGSQPRSVLKKHRIPPAKGCSKHMTGDRSRLRNFVKKFIGTVRFGNDHFGAIMGYGDYVIGDSVISRVYYVEGLGHNLFSVGQFCDSDLEVAFRKHSCYVRDTDGVELLKGSRGSNLYTISVEDMLKSSPF
ncbi:hypothetical protein Tco_1292670 [Tanacetum coccineum]